jgi:hypothetical protein
MHPYAPHEKKWAQARNLVGYQFIRLESSWVVVS